MAASIPWDDFHHISRAVADLDRALVFYREVMGFAEVARPDLGFRGAWLQRGPLQVHLIEGQPPERAREINSRADHLAFHTTDVAAAESALKEHGVEYVRKVQRGSGVVQLFFQDPDGNCLEIGTYPNRPA